MRRTGEGERHVVGRSVVARIWYRDSGLGESDPGLLIGPGHTQAEKGATSGMHPGGCERWIRGKVQFSITSD